ncbi:MAG: adenosine kinase [Candidatus Tectimicrobiota bacterium]|nr:MAG: adenosine kinase [Candidatus Tectomicrobia bacterium]
MSVLVVGSVAFDSVETPFGAAEEVLGGSATYFAVAASYFTPVRLVGVVGEDFPQEHEALLRRHGVDTAGLARRPGRTFRWRGRYGYDLNEAHTLETQLGVFADFAPQLPPAYRTTPYVFLANIDPEVQLQVLEQVQAPRFVACDTMNFWIEGKREALLATLRRVDYLLLNEAEARALAQEPNTIRAGRRILQLGPRAVIIKRGEYGVLYLTPQSCFFAPAYPLEEVFDPTGAGDAFAGGFMGALARNGALDAAAIKRAILYGSAMASFNVEDFSLRRLTRLTPAEIEQRVAEFQRFVTIEEL